MNQLLNKFNEYKSIVNYRIEYIFEDHSTVSFKWKQTDFPHLIGLHKLIDIPVIRQFNDQKNTDVIIDFNASLIASNLKAKYILFEKKAMGYHHLCIAEDGEGKKYAESFFCNATDLYIRNQVKIKVKGVRVYDNLGVLYLEDMLF